MRYLIFGIGKFYSNRREIISNYNGFLDIVAFVDNRAEEVREFEGKSVYLPKQVLCMDWDYIVIMSSCYDEMRNQLVSLGVSIDKIMSWDGYHAFLLGTQTYTALSKKMNTFSKYRILLVSNGLTYDGSSMVIFYAALELSSRGYDVTLLAPLFDESLKEKLLFLGVNIKVNHAIKYLNKERFKEFSDYDMAIVNVYPNVRVACELSKYIPTLWWIHENGKYFDDDYAWSRLEFSKYNNIDEFRMVRVAAVSHWAADVFEKYYPNRVDSILSLGIADEPVLKYECSTEKKITFAVIGRIEERKAQDIFLDAILNMDNELRDKAEFLIIGADSGSKDFVTQIKYKASLLSNVKLTGVLNRKAMREQFFNIDVVVCPSREETLSITIVEGLMNSKICLTTDATGVAEYISDGINGFVIPANDVRLLTERLEYIIDNIHNCDNLKEKARELYKNNFSMEIFGDNLELEISKTIADYVR